MVCGGQCGLVLCGPDAMQERSADGGGVWSNICSFPQTCRGKIEYVFLYSYNRTYLYSYNRVYGGINARRPNVARCRRAVRRMRPERDSDAAGRRPARRAKARREAESLREGRRRRLREMETRPSGRGGRAPSATPSAGGRSVALRSATDHGSVACQAGGGGGGDGGDAGSIEKSLIWVP